MAILSPRRSKIKKLRKQGFLKRMSTRGGRKTISRQRRAGRRVNVELK